MKAYALKITADNSPTLYDPDFDACLHSEDGALGESRHVFLEQGQVARRLADGFTVRILEIGLGTGLNFTLTRELLQQYPDASIDYIAFEPRPIDPTLLAEFYTHVDIRRTTRERHPGDQSRDDAGAG